MMILEDVARVRHENELLERNDAEAAVERLQLLAGYLRRGEVVPARLAKFFTDAIDGSLRGGLTVERKRDTLQQALGLKAPGKRAINTSTAETIGWAMFKHASSGASVNEAAQRVAIEYGVGETTAKRFFKDLIGKLVADQEREIG